MESGTQVSLEPSLGYHPCSIEVLTMYRETGTGTLSDGQFDWGGRLLKSNGGAQRFPQHGRKSCEECKGIRELDCETYRSSKDESRA
ncbi:ribonuclease PH [Peptoclostridium litorale DSM 5388]|uniref:Ribonuclease PH n=1 Tax=Peptoclostridium litorale DSM 5388 TaxID=1121324 RepID=A0A069RJB6_PEPLI|nr:ribonuclease PH [Peptoclostridium litorale DSM 5388]